MTGHVRSHPESGRDPAEGCPWHGDTLRPVAIKVCESDHVECSEPGCGFETWS